MLTLVRGSVLAASLDWRIIANSLTESKKVWVSDGQMRVFATLSPQSDSRRPLSTLEEITLRLVSMRVPNKLRNWMLKVREEPARYSVHCDETGLTQIVHRGDSKETVRLIWGQVRNVFAYKRDCFAIDEIRLLIEGPEKEHWIEVTENDDGYEHLLQQMPIRIPGFPGQGEWWQRVALPPSKTQWTQIYARERQIDDKLIS